ncbi:MAG: hypothetical protein ACYDH6_16045 [Acidimicrobiales bacterium]
MKRLVGTALLVLGLVVLGAGAAGADTTTTQPPNADDVTASLVGGGNGAVFAGIVFTTGVAGLGVGLLQRYLHAAVDAS